MINFVWIVQLYFAVKTLTVSHADWMIGFDWRVCLVRSGRAIQHVKENIFTAEGGMRRGIPNVLVVLTDGRSQDDVNKVSKEMQMAGRSRVVYGFMSYGASFDNYLHVNLM